MCCETRARERFGLSRRATQLLGEGHGTVRNCTSGTVKRKTGTPSSFSFTSSRSLWLSKIVPDYAVALLFAIPARLLLVLFAAG